MPDKILCAPGDFIAIVGEVARVLSDGATPVFMQTVIEETPAVPKGEVHFINEMAPEYSLIMKLGATEAKSLIP